jgi:hypothetical protein
MRDPERIDRVLAKLGEAWFYTEDDKWEEWLDDLLAERPAAETGASS